MSEFIEFNISTPEPTGVVGVIAIGGRNAGEHVLIAFTFKQIAVIHGLFAELGQQRVARPVNLDLADDFQDRAGLLLRLGGRIGGLLN